jgi:hypothetical protein
MSNNLRNWKFLIGNWESDPETHIGNEKGTVNKANFSHKPSDQFLFMINEAYRSGNPQGESWSLFFYDENEDKVKNKSVYGMGFIVNYVEEYQTDNEVIFTAASVDSMPEGFEESAWRLKLKKLSEDKFSFALLMGKEGEYTIFWEAIYNRI